MGRPKLCAEDINHRHDAGKISVTYSAYEKESEIAACVLYANQTSSYPSTTVSDSKF